MKYLGPTRHPRLNEAVAVVFLLAGLFVYVVCVVGLGMERNGFAAAIALSVTMTPIVPMFRMFSAQMSSSKPSSLTT